MADEHRRQTRPQTRLSVSYIIRDGRKHGKALTKNISDGGIRFIAEHSLAPGAVLDLTLHFPERTEPIRCVAKVVWSQPLDPEEKTRNPDGVRGKTLRLRADEVGVAFVEIDPKDSVLLRQFALLYFPHP